MRRLIFDELEHAQEMIKQNKFLIKELSVTELLALAKYFKYTLKMSKPEIKRGLDNFCRGTSMKYISAFFDNRLNFVIKLCEKKEPRVYTPIAVTSTEAEAIRSIDDDRMRKILFAMLVMAKFFKLTSVSTKPKKKQEQNTPTKLYYNNGIMEAFNQMRIASNYYSRVDMMYKIQHSGLVDVGYRGSYEILFAKDDDDISFYVEYIDCLKLYYQKYFEDIDVGECVECGRPFKRIRAQANKSSFSNLCSKCFLK